MNRRWIGAIVMLLCSSVVNAQNTSELFDFQISAFEENIPRGLLLTVPDKQTQILFNPARAALWDKTGFVQSLSQTSANQPITLNGLWDNKWLVNVRYFGDTDNSNSQTMSLRDEIINNVGIPDNTRTERDETIRELKRADQQASVQLGSIKKTGNDRARYRGGYISYSADDFDNTNTDLDNRTAENYQIVNSSLLLNRRDTENLFIRNEENNTYRVTAGVNQSMVRGNKDLIVNLAYQFERTNDNSILSNRYMETTQDFIDGMLDGSATMNILSSEQSGVEQNNHSLYGSLFFSNRYGENNEHFRYSKIQTSYGLGFVDVFSRSFDVQNGVNQTTLAPFEQDDRVHQYHVDIETGYSRIVTGQNYQLQIGGELEVLYRYSENYTASVLSTSAVIDETSMNDVRVQMVIPAFSSFTILDRLQVWGGANLNLRYTYSETDVHREQVLFSNAEFISLQGNRRSDTDFTIDRVYYVGLLYQHHSGLRGNIDLGNNLSQLSSWRISLAYQF
ncbi:MAG: hypothetical protein AAFW89_07495 [Bacteroidota bacterium]